MSTVVAIAAVAFLASVLVRVPPLRRAVRQRRRKATLQALRRRYRRMLDQPQALADQTMARQLADLTRRFPAKPEQWRLRKLIADLERARK